MATTLRNGILAAVALVTALSPLACAGREDGFVPDESLGAEDSALRKRPEASRCFRDVIEAACASADEYKQKAASICRSKGAYLTNLDLGNACFYTGFVSAKYECCALATDPPEPPPIPPRCMSTTFASDICHPNDLWKQRASTWCDLNGLVLNDIAYGGCIEKTADVSRATSNRVKVECCTYNPPPPPPPPVKCTTDVVGDGSGCNANDLLKQKASLSCEAAGLVLRDIAYANDCPTSTNATGSSTYAKYACCSDSK